MILFAANILDNICLSNELFITVTKRCSYVWNILKINNVEIYIIFIYRLLLKLFPAVNSLINVSIDKFMISTAVVNYSRVNT